MQARVKGMEQLQKVGRLLEAEGNPRKIKTAIGKEIRQVVKPIGEQAQQNALATLPHSGGLNEWVASARMSVQVRTTARGAGVRLTAKRKTKKGRQAKLQDIDSGTVRHRVCGSNNWVTQRVRPGWFTDPAEKSGPEIQTALLGVLDDIAHRLEGRP